MWSTSIPIKKGCAINATFRSLFDLNFILHINLECKKCSLNLLQQMDSPSFGSREVSDSEILDELTTSRGELKVRTVSFREERHGQVI